MVDKHVRLAMKANIEVFGDEGGYLPFHLFCPEIVEVACVMKWRHCFALTSLMPKKFQSAEDRRAARLLSKRRHYTR
jgi:hypothetical protein